jgi:hypothetical protein
MRIVIDIEGDQVRVHRIDGGETPPAEVLLRAAALGAESAGIAMVPGGVATVAALGIEPTDAGRGPSTARRAGKAARTVHRSSRRRPAPRAGASRRRKR